MSSISCRDHSIKTLLLFDAADVGWKRLQDRSHLRWLDVIGEGLQGLTVTLKDAEELAWDHQRWRALMDQVSSVHDDISGASNMR